MQDKNAAKIQGLLDDGYKVTSLALGRVGRVVNTSGQRIVHFESVVDKQLCATTFDSGDEVEIFTNHIDKTARIVNREIAE